MKVYVVISNTHEQGFIVRMYQDLLKAANFALEYQRDVATIDEEISIEEWEVE